MRDIVVSIVVFGMIPFILARPYIGILVWSWIGYMNPHRLAYGFAQNMPFAQIIAIVTVLALLFSKDRKSLPGNTLTALWFLFVAWMVVTTQFAIFPADASAYLYSVLKIQFVAVLTMALITNQRRIEWLIVVIVLSIGFYSVKGGLFTLVTGGASRVFGPPGGMIEENNSLALATLMTIPLMFFLYQQAKRRSARLVLLAMIVLSAVSVFGSQSRGAIVAGGVLVFGFWLKSSQKVATALALVILIPPLILFMPESWHERIGTMSASRKAEAVDIQSMHARGGGGVLSAPIPSRDWLGYWPNDFSALGRVNAWNYAINVANDRLTGAGFESWSPETFAKYAPIVEEVQGGHSIYFSVLADHGWPGLLMFGSILFVTWRYAGKLARESKTGGFKTEVDGQAWIGQLMQMIQLSLISYCVAGAFLSLAYFDLPWHLVSIVLICRQLSKDQLLIKGNPVPSIRIDLR
jgi:putative inorganic carbon (hco3(-)) transporter